MSLCGLFAGCAALIRPTKPQTAPTCLPDALRLSGLQNLQTAPTCLPDALHLSGLQNHKLHLYVCRMRCAYPAYKTTNCTYMFAGCAALIRPTKLANCTYMFAGCAALIRPTKPQTAPICLPDALRLSGLQNHKLHLHVCRMRCAYPAYKTCKLHVNRRPGKAQPPPGKTTARTPEKTKAPNEGALVYSRSLSFSLSRWFTGGFPPTSTPLMSSTLGRFRFVLTL
ncbi:hypothetical protein D3C73_323470 [compost metagenome]